MTTFRNDLGQRVSMRGRTGDQNQTQALNAVRIERERLAAWRALDDPERDMVQLVVRATLRRLLEDPHWIPTSTRLGRGRLDLFFVVELDEDQVDAAAAARDLDLEMARARDEFAEVQRMLAEDDDDD